MSSPSAVAPSGGTPAFGGTARVPRDALPASCLLLVALVALALGGCELFRAFGNRVETAVAQPSKAELEAAAKKLACAACRVDGRPITYSAKKDTAETIAQVRALNAGCDAICKPARR